MKKIVLALLLVLSLTFFCGTTIFASAETVTTDSEVLSDMQDYLNKYENEEIAFFNQKILPLLIGVGTTILGYIVSILPNIKKNKKYNQMAGYVSAIKDENADLKKQLADLQYNKELEKQATQNFLDKFHKETEKVTLDMNLFSKIAGLEEENQAQLEKIVSCLLYIVADEPNAVKTLTATASQKVVEKDEKIIENLKNALRKLSGETAEDIIKTAEQV